MNNKIIERTIAITCFTGGALITHFNQPSFYEILFIFPLSLLIGIIIGDMFEIIFNKLTKK